MLSLRELQRIFAGEISNGELHCAGPGHSRADRSLSLRPVEDGPNDLGLMYHSFADDDPTAIEDFLREKLNTPSRSRTAMAASACRKTRSPTWWRARRWRKATAELAASSSRRMTIPTSTACCFIKCCATIRSLSASAGQMAMAAGSGNSATCSVCHISLAGAVEVSRRHRFYLRRRKGRRSRCFAEPLCHHRCPR